MSIYKKFTVRSKIKDYSVYFSDDFGDGLESGLDKRPFIMIDGKVARLYKKELGRFLKKYSHLVIEATEPNKALANINTIIRRLIDNDVKKSHVLVAMGGGIIQDITGFIASIMYRGMDWIFYPTTLLAQSDSCIGSKTSINVDGYKNQIGNFYPPRKIFLNTGYLKTLSDADIRSGLGEIIKVHLLDGKKMAGYVAVNYEASIGDPAVMDALIYNSLKIKKGVIEKDEFDAGYRNIMNYGHTFGHSLESVTGYRVPHGQAVTVGMDISNYLSWKIGYINEAVYRWMRLAIEKNMPSLENFDINMAAFFKGLTKDKKNVDSRVAMILTRGPGKMFKEAYPLDGRMKNLIRAYFKKTALR
jgi:3-dehydroquinate synthase